MYKFIIIDTTGHKVFTSITNCKTVSSAQKLGYRHLRLNNYNIGSQVRVIQSDFAS